MSSAANPIVYYWRGEGPLWRVYWLWGVAGSLMLAGLFGWGLLGYGVSWGYVLIAGVVMGLYTVWILVSVWRCADNVREARWGDAARMLTAAWALNVVLVGLFLIFDLLG